MQRLMIAALILAALDASPAVAAAPAATGFQDPDWPCQQRLVPTLSAGTLWSGPSPAQAGDWRADPAVAALVARIEPRRVATADGVAAIDGFVRGVDQNRARLASLAFSGLLEETNRERSELIARIKLFAHRQRDLAALTERITGELHSIPPDAKGADADRRADLEQRRLFTTQAFVEAQRTVRYACDIPAQLEARLGAYARALQAGLL